MNAFCVCSAFKLDPNDEVVGQHLDNVRALRASQKADADAPVQGIGRLSHEQMLVMAGDKCPLYGLIMVFVGRYNSQRNV
jgi:hypothetical protein